MLTNEQRVQIRQLKVLKQQLHTLSNGQFFEQLLLSEVNELFSKGQLT